MHEAKGRSRVEHRSDVCSAVYSCCRWQCATIFSPGSYRNRPAQSTGIIRHLRISLPYACARDRQRRDFSSFTVVWNALDLLSLMSMSPAPAMPNLFLAGDFVRESPMHGADGLSQVRVSLAATHTCDIRTRALAGTSLPPCAVPQ